MIAAALNFIMWIAGFFGYGKPDPVAQGENLGKAETENTALKGELQDVQDAKDARETVANGIAASPNELREPDKFERP